MSALPKRSPAAVFDTTPGADAASVPEGAPKLKGHSGATLQVLESGRAWFVRKAAADKSRNDRLLRQSILQRRLISYGLAMPCVLADGIGPQDRAYLDMEYIPAPTLAELLARAAPNTWEPVIAVLERTFRLFRLTRGPHLDAGLFHAKIGQIARQCADLPSCGGHQRELANIASRLQAMAWHGIPSSLSHGDMTLENMLYSPARGVVFLDCDQVFASSYWLDAGKLFQDLAGFWCLRELPVADGTGLEDSAPAQRLQQFACAVMGMLENMDPKMARRVHQLAALHLLRTLPYGTSSAGVGFVLARISSLLSMARS